MITLKKANMGYGKETILKNIDIEIKEGELIAIIGNSGAGKTTFLNSLNLEYGFLKAEKAEFFGTNIKDMEYEVKRDIKRKIGFIYQAYNLIERSTVFDNVAVGFLDKIPLNRAIFKLYKEEEIELVENLLKEVKLKDFVLKKCKDLSGGQKQRVAIARALAQQSKIILADEPISSLDPNSAKEIINTLRLINKMHNMTVIVNLHHLEYAKNYFDRIIGINGGEIVFDDSKDKLTTEVLETIYT